LHFAKQVKRGLSRVDGKGNNPNRCERFLTVPTYRAVLRISGFVLPAAEED
jgi:hypothetical protein